MPLQYGAKVTAWSVASTMRYPTALLRGGGGAEQAAAGEASEAALLVDELTGDEGDAEQLAVRVLDRRARLAARVHDDLAVAQPGGALVLLDPVADRRHHEVALVVVERAPGQVVVGREDEHLVDAARRRLGEHRAAVVDHEGLQALERGVAVGHHPDQPLALCPVGLERRRRRVLVSRAERAVVALVDAERLAGEEDRAPCRAVRGDGDPAAGEGVESELVHRGEVLCHRHARVFQPG